MKKKPDQEDINSIFKSIKTIAVADMSEDPGSDSYALGTYFKKRGFDILPLSMASNRVAGMPCYASVLNIPINIKVDAVVIFKERAEIGSTVVEAVQRGVRVIWMQPNHDHKKAADYARSHKIRVVTGRCMMETYKASLQPGLVSAAAEKRPVHAKPAR
jgi:predicted CoA-binding protein